jgi:MFS family permease
VAVPLGPWVEFRRKRPVMVAADLLRGAAVLSVPLAFALGALTFAQLVLVSVVVGAADVAFRSAGGAHLKGLVPPADLLRANGRFESTTWTAAALGPALGGALLGLLGPVTTVLLDAGSYLLSALGVLAIRRAEPEPPRPHPGRRAADVLDGWRYVLGDPALRALFATTTLANALIMATAPLMATLMVGELGFSALEYGLAFGLPCVGGLLGARVARPLVRRFGQHRVLVTAAVLRTLWSLGPVFVHPGPTGLALVMATQFGLVLCAGGFNTVFTTYRLERTADDRVARTLSAWTVSGKLVTAAVTALWGLLAALVGVREAVAAAAALLVATSLLLPRRAAATAPAPA